MNINVLHGFELDVIKYVQVLRNPLLDSFMGFLNSVDSFLFYVLVVACVWYLYGRTCGLKLLYLFVINAVVNFDLKVMFSLPRPFQLNPEVGVLSVSGFGFPSGAAQSTTALFGFLALTFQKRWFWLSSIAVVLVMSFSRVYLGVHFPSDVIGGWVIGGIVLGCFYVLLPVVESSMFGQPKITLLYLSLIFTLILSFFALNEQALLDVFFVFGASVGCLVALPPPDSSSISRRFLGLFIAVLGIVLVLYITSLIVPFFESFGSDSVTVFVRIVSYFIGGMCLPCGSLLILKKDRTY